MLFALVLTSCGANNTPNYGQLLGSPTVIGTMTKAQLDSISSANGLLTLAGAAECDVKMVQINYQTSGVQLGEVSNASGALMIPSGSGCSGPFPLAAFARGTNLEKNHTNADTTDPSAELMMTFFAAHGYAVVATDYLGYALSAYPYHPYMHANSEATAVIDSIRAARLAAPMLGLVLNGKVMISGYSQGGHSAMATQRAIEAADTGEFNLVASAPLAGPYYVSQALIHGVATPINGVQDFVPFQIIAYQKIYGNVYSSTSDIFNAPYDSYIGNLLPSLLDATTLASLLPSGTPDQNEHAMLKPAYLSDLASNPSNPTIVAAAKQDLLGWNPKTPTTLCGGMGDPTVSFTVNAEAVYNDFLSRGLTNVSLVDVDPEIQAVYGKLNATTYNSYYHGMLEPPFCMKVARQFFDQYK